MKEAVLLAKYNFLKFVLLLLVIKSELCRRFYLNRNSIYQYNFFDYATYL